MFKQWIALAGLMSVLPFLCGQGCGASLAPPPSETPRERVFNLCRPLYPDSYIESLISTYNDARAVGLSATETRLAAQEGCDEGCGNAYYEHNDQVYCTWQCYPCVDAMISLTFEASPTNKESSDELSSSPNPALLDALALQFRAKLQRLTAGGVAAD